VKDDDVFLCLKTLPVVVIAGNHIYAANAHYQTALSRDFAEQFPEWAYRIWSEALCRCTTMRTLPKGPLRLLHPLIPWMAKLHLASMPLPRQHQFLEDLLALSHKLTGGGSSGSVGEGTGDAVERLWVSFMSEQVDRIPFLVQYLLELCFKCI